MYVVLHAARHMHVCHIIITKNNYLTVTMSYYMKLPFEHINENLAPRAYNKNRRTIIVSLNLSVIIEYV